MTLLRAEGLTLAGRLQPTSLNLEAGQMVAVVGPNGGGKTSLLRALARVEEASGSVYVNDEDLDRLPEARRRQLLGFMPASRDFHWPIRVEDMIAMGSALPDRVNELIALLELDSLRDRPVDQLSTGERARVILARTLAAKPALLLLDEPLSNLEPYWALRFLEILQAEAARGALLVITLHDLELLPRFARAILVAGGQVHKDEAPADLLASERFASVFRVRQDREGWQIIPPADPRSSP